MERFAHWRRHDVRIQHRARAALRGKLGGVLFLDAGNVWTDFREVDFGDIRYSVGAGLRYQTPVVRSASTLATS